MARHSEDLYGKYGVYGLFAYDFSLRGNEGPGDYCCKAKSIPAKLKLNQGRRSPALTVACLLCAVFMLVGLMSRSSLIVLSQETVSARKEVEELLAEQRVLKIRHEMAFSLAETEEYAIEVLGMQKPSADQINYIDILPQETEEQFSENTGDRDLISIIRAYFSG